MYPVCFWGRCTVFIIFTTVATQVNVNQPYSMTSIYVLLLYRPKSKAMVVTGRSVHLGTIYYIIDIWKTPKMTKINMLL